MEIIEKIKKKFELALLNRNAKLSYSQCGENLITSSIFTILRASRSAEQKISEVIDYVCQTGYFIYADTFINSIFVNKEIWSQRS